MVIWKFPLALVDHPGAVMPEGAQILTVQTQHGTPCLWALVDPQAKPQPRVFRIVGTGHPFEDAAHHRYIGTFQLGGGALVFHLFERQE